MLNSRKRKGSDDKVLRTGEIKKLRNDTEAPQAENGSKHVSEAKTKVSRLLPEGYKSIIVTASYKVEDDGYDAIYGCIRLPIVSQADALNWIKKFQLKTLTSYSVEESWTKDAATGLFRIKFECSYHKNQPGSTKCKACLIFTIKDPKEIETNSEYYLRDYPSQVVLQFCHNHKMDAQPFKDLHKTFQAYYQTGHSPFSALVCHKCDLHSLYGPEFYNMISSNMCPSYNWCCQEYVKLFKKDFTCPSKEELEESLKKLVGEYNKQCGSECAVLGENSLTLCSPLMKSVFKLGFAEDLVTVRCFTALKLAPKAHKVFLFLCHTPIGSLPFGVILMSGAEQVGQGISTLLQLLGTPSYRPKNIITDESTNLNESLKLAFPQTKIIFDEFQMLQSIWRVIRLVCKDDHQEFQKLYDLFVITLSSNSLEEYKRNFNNLQCRTVKYPELYNFLKYFNKRANNYVSYCRPKVEFNMDVLNYTDSGTIILRDVAVKYSNHLNLVQLFDFLTKTYVTHYERKLDKIVNGDLKGFYKTNFYVPPEKMAEFTCEKISNTEFSVSSNRVKCFVNAELDTCTCQLGVHGGSCVHQFLVEKNLGLVPECYTPLGEDMLGIFKSVLGHKVSVDEITEKTAEIAEFLSNLPDTRDEEVSNLTEYVMENGSMEQDMVVIPPEEVLVPPNKINILSSVIIKPSLNLATQNKEHKPVHINSEEHQPNGLNVSQKGDATLDVAEIDSDTVEELASKDIEGLNDILVDDSNLVQRLSLAFSQLSKLAETKKFQDPIRKFVDKFQELASSDRLIWALENFGQLKFVDSYSESDESYQFEHYSDCSTSCSNFHSELEEVDRISPEPVDVTAIKLPPGIRLSRITENNNKVQAERIRPKTPKRNKMTEPTSKELEDILMGTEEVVDRALHSKPQASLLNGELSFLFKDPRFEAIVEDDPPGEEEEPPLETNDSPSPVSPSTAFLAASTGVVVRTLEPEPSETKSLAVEVPEVPKVVVKPSPKLRSNENSPAKTPNSERKPPKSRKPSQTIKPIKVSSELERRSTRKRLPSDSDDSEILDTSSLKLPKRTRSRPPEIQKKSNLELIVLLERSIKIELLCKAKMTKKSHRVANKKMRRGYKELLEHATKMKYT